jgi:uncharacterized protein YlxW (UPF0749 family)
MSEDEVERQAAREPDAGGDEVLDERAQRDDGASEPDDSRLAHSGPDEGSGSGDGAGNGAPRWWAQRLPTRSGALIGVLLALLGFALAVQLKGNDQDQELAGARQEDLVRILDDLDSRKERLQREISSLNVQKQQISSGEQGRQAALNEARQRADELGILAGTLAAQGPGLSVRFAAGKDAIPAGVVLDAVEELRGAGAEAMQISGSSGGSVRIVASTSFVDSGAGLLVDSKRLTGPYTVLVIGDPSTMQAALNIPGGVVDTVRRAGGRVEVGEPRVVRVSQLRPVSTPRFARPVS